MPPDCHILADVANWPVLLSFLPAGWQHIAKTSGALTGARASRVQEHFCRHC